VLIRKSKDPFCEIRINGPGELLLGEGAKTFVLEHKDEAELAQRLASRCGYVRDRNPRNAVIASIRWMIRHRTEESHDRQFASLIDAAFTAAGKEPPFLGQTSPFASERGVHVPPNFSWRGSMSTTTSGLCRTTAEITEQLLARRTAPETLMSRNKFAMRIFPRKVKPFRRMCAPLIGFRSPGGCVKPDY
jgi:hypothetical protein